MKLSEKLYAKAREQWEEAANKPFVVGMAWGTLEVSRFRNYMIQDFLYLKDYIDILKRALERADDGELREFLRGLVAETEQEFERVHLPNMVDAGVDVDNLANYPRLAVIDTYVAYMKRQMEEGILEGLTALLQCSWAYAYIGESVSARFAGVIAASPYKSWFDAYTSDAYVETNRKWIDFLDREAEGIDQKKEEALFDVFTTCAAHENRLWDALIAQSPF